MDTAIIQVFIKFHLIHDYYLIPAGHTVLCCTEPVWASKPWFCHTSLSQHGYRTNRWFCQNILPLLVWCAELILDSILGEKLIQLFPSAFSTIVSCPMDIAPQMSGSESKITLMFALVTSFSPRRSCGSPLTNIAGTVVVTISPIQLQTKYVLMHECDPFMLSSPSAVSVHLESWTALKE